MENYLIGVGIGSFVACGVLLYLTHILYKKIATETLDKTATLWLLMKYLNHVRSCEGIDYLDNNHEEYLSDIDYQTLKGISATAKSIQTELAHKKE